MRFADSHLHSIYSFDTEADATFEAIVANAEKNGMFFIAITDHYEVNAPHEDIYSPYPMDAAKRYITSKIESYKGPLKISYGIELAQPHHFPEDAKSFLEKYAPTTVNCSLHSTRGVRDFYYVDFKSFTQDEIKERWDKYLNELFEAVDFEGIDTLCHISYPLRYIFATGNSFDISYSFDTISKVFEKMIKKNICLECNTSLLYRETPIPLRQTTEKKIFELYRECGGKLISLGSDAHSPVHIGGGYGKAAELLTSCGFHELAFVYNKNIETYKI